MLYIFFFLMFRGAPSSTRTDTPFPYTTLCRSGGVRQALRHVVGGERVEAARRRQCQRRDVARMGLAAHHVRRAADRGEPRLLRQMEEHTSELQSLMRISYAVFCLKKKNNEHTPQKRTAQLQITPHESSNP